jgi:hypothetical protein
MLMVENHLGRFLQNNYFLTQMNKVTGTNPHEADAAKLLILFNLSFHLLPQLSPYSSFSTA